LLDALIWTESRCNPLAVSKAGAAGLGQLMPGTARELGVANRFDPRANLSGAARYLRQMLDRFGSSHLALAAYNAGPGAVEQARNTDKWRDTRIRAQHVASLTFLILESCVNRARKRVSGILERGPRGLFIVTESGDRWVLELDDPDPAMLNKPVIAEGMLAGYDRLRIDWIGEVWTYIYERESSRKNPQGSLSPSFTRVGSQVQSLSRPPFFRPWRRAIGAYCERGGQPLAARRASDATP